MRVRLASYLGASCPAVISDDVFAVLLESESGDPLAILYEVQPGVVAVSKYGDADFRSCLMAAGFDGRLVLAQQEYRRPE